MASLVLCPCRSVPLARTKHANLHTKTHSSIVWLNINDLLDLLPMETIDRILFRLPYSELKNMRLLCRRLCAPATRRLFNMLHLSPREDSIHNFNKILANDRLRGEVQEVEINTFPEIGSQTENGYRPDMATIKSTTHFLRGRCPKSGRPLSIKSHRSLI